MYWQTKRKHFMRIILFGILFLGINSVSYSECTQSAKTTRSTEVYDRAPIFSSSSGWQLGNVVNTLPPDTNVKICEDVKVGLFLDKKIWYKIEFGSGRVGWVFSRQLNISAESLNSPKYVSFFIPEVQAQNSHNNDQGVPGYALWMMLFGALIFVIVGMFCKVAYDEIDKEQPITLSNILNLRKCIKALLIAPMIFATFLIAGDFNIGSEISIVIFFCMAFQNGFFWQTVVPTGKVAVKNA